MKFNHIDFAYFGHKGVITAAFEMFKNEAGVEFLKVAFAYCSPRDQFNRSTGRKLAMKRLLNGKVRNKQGTHNQASWTITSSGDSMEDVRNIFNKLVPRDFKPQWCKDTILVPPSTGTSVTNIVLS